MYEIILTIHVAEGDGPLVQPRVIRLQFDSEAGLELWLRSCADGRTAGCVAATELH